MRSLSMNLMRTVQGIRNWNRLENARQIVLFLLLLVIKFKRMLMRHKKKAFSFLAMTLSSYQYTFHRTFWIGFWDTLRVCSHFRRNRNFRKQTYISSKDGEEYAVWTLKNGTRSNAVHDANINSTVNVNSDHIWICLPGGMEAIDPAFSALISKQTFKGSGVCIFNNPGISTKMKLKPLPSPTETTYLIEYIEALQRENGYRVSLIGFSIGSVQALRTLHDITNDPWIHNRIHLDQVVMVHGPDIVRDAIEHFKHNWLIRMDIYFAAHIRYLQHRSGSWKMVIDRLKGKNDNARLSVFDGWSFIRRVSEVSLGKEWDECEREMFNVRTFCDESIQTSATKVYRIMAQNDWIVLDDSIDSQYFKYLDEVFVSRRGGHCGVTQCAQTVDKIVSWNDKAVQGGNRKMQNPFISRENAS